jgi:flagellar biosynthesis/type III secretory pathway M-ring protein FliF/YscJ
MTPTCKPKSHHPLRKKNTDTQPSQTKPKHFYELILFIIIFFVLIIIFVLCFPICIPQLLDNDDVYHS